MEYERPILQTEIEVLVSPRGKGQPTSSKKRERPSDPVVHYGPRGRTVDPHTAAVSGSYGAATAAHGWTVKNSSCCGPSISIDNLELGKLTRQIHFLHGP